MKDVIVFVIGLIIIGFVVFGLFKAVDIIFEPVVKVLSCNPAFNR